MDRYYIKNQYDELYVHFDPNINNYKIMGTLLGSALFTKISANNFMKEAGFYNDEWELIPINKNTKITHTSRLNEKNIYLSLSTEKTK